MTDELQKFLDKGLDRDEVLKILTKKYKEKWTFVDSDVHEFELGDNIKPFRRVKIKGNIHLQYRLKDEEEFTKLSDFLDWLGYCNDITCDIYNPGFVCRYNEPDGSIVATIKHDFNNPWDQEFMPVEKDDVLDRVKWDTGYAVSINYKEY